MNSPLVENILRRLSSQQVPLDWYAGKRALVTGGAGFIGSWLVEALVTLGSDVFVVDNLWRGSLENLRLNDGLHSIDLDSRFDFGDLRNYEVALAACLRSKADIVFHLADVVAGVDFVFANEPFLFRANMLINSNVLAAVREAHVPGLVYLGTACSYPRELQVRAGESPLQEDQIYPANPESGYGWSKLMGEYEVALLGGNSDTNVGVLRLHNVYGPRAILSRKRSQVIPSLIRKAIRFPEEDFVVWGSGEQTRDFVFVGDVIDALLRLPTRGMGRGPIQIATAQETSIATLATMIVEISGKEIPITFDRSKPEGDHGRSGSYARAAELLGWDVFTPLENGLRQTYLWAEEKIANKRVNLDE
jgi:nucleoside-diphosphate-sugar epimerase